jgi:hypothetical protein
MRAAKSKVQQLFFFSFTAAIRLSVKKIIIFEKYWRKMEKFDVNPGLV